MNDVAIREYETGMKAKEAENFMEAYQCFLKAANLGHAAACNELGECFFYGNGTTKNANEAFKWYMKAAEAGNAAGQGNVGYCYANGIGIAQSYPKSIEWLQKASDQNDGDAQLNLGNRYREGQGVKKDPTTAIKYYLMAAQNDNAMGYFAAGIMYYEGHEGIKQSYKNAYDLLEKCAEKTNHRQARYLIGEMSLLGKGVEKDLIQARNNLSLSALQGYSDAIELIDQNEYLFDEKITNGFYNWIMSLNVKFDDMTKSPDFQLFSISNVCSQRGIGYADTIGIIASRLFDLAMNNISNEQAVKINFIKLAKKWILKK